MGDVQEGVKVVHGSKHAVRETKRLRAENEIRAIYDRLWKAYGPQHWWPADTATEVVVGAILTQNTAWTNVERAIEVLRDANCLNWEALRHVSVERLAEYVRPSGTYRVKAARLKAFVDCLWTRHDGDLSHLLGGSLDEARDRLLAISGIGPETADAILLYAGERPTFVVDAYTKRILRRHGVIGKSATYEEVRTLFHEALPEDAGMFNEFHAALVVLGKRHCRSRAICDGCPLEDLLHDAAL